MKRLVPLFLAAGTLLVGAPGILYAQKTSLPAASNLVTLSFNNAEIAEVARALGVITGRSVVVDPRVKGTINLNTDKPVTKAAAYEQFLAALRLQGFVAVDVEGLSKIVPEAEAKLQGGNVSAGAVKGPGNQIVTQIFRLNYETANNLVPVLRPLISPNNTINVNPGNNSLIITDYTDNLQRMARIVAALDVPNASDVEIIPLKYAIAADVVPLVLRLIDTGPVNAAGQGQADSSFKTAIIAEPRSNAVIIRASNPARTALVRALVERLDQPGNSETNPAGNMHVVYLKNADAVKLAATLRAAISSSSSSSSTPSSAAGAPSASPSILTTGMSTGSGAATSPTQASAQPSTGGQIQADPSTNSLIISASEPQYRQLRAVIDQLDGRRAQVLVESLIVEVNAAKMAQFGIQWQGLLGSANSSNVGLLGTNFSTNATTNILALATATGKAGGTIPSTGGNIGIAHKTNGVYVLGFLANFLESNSDGNVLSTPNLLTLDNEEAKIVIGENVPFVTGSFSSTNSTNGTGNPFQTIERKDVGLTLRIKPQINENGTIKLVIFQEDSNVKAGTETAVNGPTTTKRSIESTVLVDDGSIVVIGGLLQDSYAGNQDKVPVAGDIPFFGNLFKSESRTRKKTNLMVFLRPVVVRDGIESDALSLNRYELMRGIQKDSQPVPNAMIPISDAPVLPPQAPPPVKTPPPLQEPSIYQSR